MAGGAKVALRINGGSLNSEKEIWDKGVVLRGSIAGEVGRCMMGSSTSWMDGRIFSCWIEPGREMGRGTCAAGTGILSGGVIVDTSSSSWKSSVAGVLVIGSTSK